MHRHGDGDGVRCTARCKCRIGLIIIYNLFTLSLMLLLQSTMLQNNDRMGVMFDLFKKFPSWGVEVEDRRCCKQKNLTDKHTH